MYNLLSFIMAIGLSIFVFNTNSVLAVTQNNNSLNSINESSNNSINLTNVIIETKSQIEKNLNEASKAIQLNDTITAIQNIEKAKQGTQQLAICATSVIDQYGLNKFE